MVGEPRPRIGMDVHDDCPYDQTPDHPPYECWCCEEPYNEDDLTYTPDGWSCQTCMTGWWLADTTKRRTLDFGGAR